MIRILVAEERSVIREGLKQIVAANRDMVIAGEVSSGQAVLSEITKNPYDVVILDVSLSGLNWLDVLKETKSQRPSLPVLLLSAHGAEDDARRAFRAGAPGYLTTEFTSDELVAAVRRVSSGGKYVTASVGESLAADLIKGEEKNRHESLSDREYQVMSLLAAGRTVSEIAQEMALSVKTVSTYRTRLLEKLDLKNNVELARYYTRFVDTRVIQCKKCGQDNPQAAMFCAFCGAALNGVGQSAVADSLPTRGQPVVRQRPLDILRTPRWFASTLVLIVVVLGAIVWRVQSATPSGTVPGQTGVPADGASTASQKGGELKHDDGGPNVSLHSDSGGYLVHFVPPSVPFFVEKVRVFGAAWPSDKTDFEVQIWDSGQNVIYSARQPVTLFPTVNATAAVPRDSRWVEIWLPGVEVKTDFFVHLFVNSSVQKGVLIGADDSAANLHSSLTRRTPEGAYKMREGWGSYKADEWWNDKSNVNWMIRVVGGNSKLSGNSASTIPALSSNYTQSGASSAPVPAQTRPLPPPEAFMKGMTFADWKSFDAPPGLYSSPMADKSLKDLAVTGANWISLVVNVSQETIASTKISRSPPRTATDDELRRMVDLAHSLGMRVLLEPQISVSNTPSYWQFDIGTAFTSEAQWQEWFASYHELINHYATFSQETGVDMLSIGESLHNTTQREDDWRRIVSDVRQRFKGPVTYHSSDGFGENMRIKWWDALDYVLVRVFSPFTDKNDPTVAELEAAWTDKGYLARFESLSKEFDKPVILAFGFRSTDGANKNPSAPKGDAQVDLQEQADAYQAALEVLWGQPWLKGIFWWQWWVTQTGGPNDTDYTPYRKPAEEVLKKFYLSR